MSETNVEQESPLSLQGNEIAEELESKGETDEAAELSTSVVNPVLSDQSEEGSDPKSQQITSIETPAVVSEDSNPQNTDESLSDLNSIPAPASSSESPPANASDSPVTNDKSNPEPQDTTPDQPADVEVVSDQHIPDTSAIQTPPSSDQPQEITTDQNTPNSSDIAAPTSDSNHADNINTLDMNPRNVETDQNVILTSSVPAKEDSKSNTQKAASDQNVTKTGNVTAPNVTGGTPAVVITKSLEKQERPERKFKEPVADLDLDRLNPFLQPEEEPSLVKKNQGCRCTIS